MVSPAAPSGGTKRVMLALHEQAPPVRPAQSPDLLFGPPAALEPRLNGSHSPQPPPGAHRHSPPAGSFWIHDDDSVKGKEGLRDRLSPSRLSKRKRRLLIILGVVLAILIVGAIIGGVLGVKAANDSLVDVLVSNSSTLGASTTSNTAVSGSGRVLLFQDAGGGLVVTEGFDSQAQSYRLEQRIPGVPKPMLNSSIQPVFYGSNADLHVFFIDTNALVRHVVRYTNQDPASQWVLDPLFADGAGENHVAKGFGLSATNFPAMDSGASSGLLGVTFLTGDANDTFKLLTTSSPDLKTAWTSTDISLANPEDSTPKQYQVNSPGLLTLPTTFVPPGQSGTAAKLAVRIIWDLASGSQAADIGSIDCLVGTSEPGRRCWPSNITWFDDATHQLLLAAPKPLRMAKFDTNQDKWGMPTSYLLTTLDSSGRYLEVHWDGTGWRGSQQLRLTDISDASDTNSFTGLAPMDNGLLFSTVNGTLVAANRGCSWWLAPCGTTNVWSLGSQVAVKVPQN